MQPTSLQRLADEINEHLAKDPKAQMRMVMEYGSRQTIQVVRYPTEEEKTLDT